MYIHPKVSVLWPLASGQNGHEDSRPRGERDGGDQVRPQEDDGALLLRDVKQLRHGPWKSSARQPVNVHHFTAATEMFSEVILTDVHGGGQGELHHEHVAVERVVWQEPDAARRVDYGDPDHRHHHVADAHDGHDHRALQHRLPQPCAFSVQVSVSGQDLRQCPSVASTCTLAA